MNYNGTSNYEFFAPGLNSLALVLSSSRSTGIANIRTYNIYYRYYCCLVEEEEEEEEEEGAKEFFSSKLGHSFFVCSNSV